MLNFEISATINAVSALKNLTSGYLLGKLDRQAFEKERQRLLSWLTQAASSLALTRYVGGLDDVDEADEFADVNDLNQNGLDDEAGHAGLAT